MTRIGFWCLFGVLVLRAGVLTPALLGRRPDLAARLAVAGALLGLFVVNTILTARRSEGAGGGASAAGTRSAAIADRIWVLGAIGLALAGALLSLV
jgi:hypothetical protein